MGATFRLGLFMLCYHLLAVDGLAEKGKSEELNIQQGISWRQTGKLRRTEVLLALQQQRPEVAIERRQEQTFSLDQDSGTTEEDAQNTLPIGTLEPNTIAANSENCQPLIEGGKLRARGEKERRASPPGPKLFCPLPSTTGSGTSESGQQQQPPPTKGKGGDEGGQAPGGTSQEQLLVLPKLFRIPVNDGDNPACYDATNGLMPVGVCQNPQQSPQPSKYDVFMSRNIDIFPRAWKLIDSQPAWPGMRECLPSHKNNGIWCCRFYSYLFHWADICWPLAAIEQMNSKGIGDWQRQQFNDPLILPP